jgi:hypothetical protein
MQKKLLLTLCSLSLIGSITNINTGLSTPEKIVSLVALAAIAGGGNHATELNRLYSEQGKAPDAYMRFTKTACLSTAVLGLDYFTSECNTMQDLGKVFAYGLSLFAASPTAANIIRPIPCLGGILTDPVDRVTGEETHPDSGAYGRGLLAYIGMRELVIQMTK